MGDKAGYWTGEFIGSFESDKGYEGLFHKMSIIDVQLGKNLTLKKVHQQQQKYAIVKIQKAMKFTLIGLVLSKSQVNLEKVLFHTPEAEENMKD